MTKDEALAKSRAVIGRCPVLVLCTLHVTGAPDARAMLNLQDRQTFTHLTGRMPKDNLFTYFTTDFNSEKMSEIALNPKTTLYYHDPETGEAVTVLGKAQIITDRHMKEEFWDDSWKAYFPAGAQGADFALFEFTPSLVKYYDGETETYKYEV